MAALNSLQDINTYLSRFFEDSEAVDLSILAGFDPRDYNEEEWNNMRKWTKAIESSSRRWATDGTESEDTTDREAASSGSLDQSLASTDTSYDPSSYNDTGKSPASGEPESGIGNSSSFSSSSSVRAPASSADGTEDTSNRQTSELRPASSATDNDVPSPELAMHTTPTSKAVPASPSAVQQPPSSPRPAPAHPVTLSTPSTLRRSSRRTAPTQLLTPSTVPTSRRQSPRHVNTSPSREATPTPIPRPRPRRPAGEAEEEANDREQGPDDTEQHNPDGEFADGMAAGGVDSDSDTGGDHDEPTTTGHVEDNHSLGQQDAQRYEQRPDDEEAIDDSRDQRQTDETQDMERQDDGRQAAQGRHITPNEPPLQGAADERVGAGFGRGRREEQPAIQDQADSLDPHVQHSSTRPGQNAANFDAGPTNACGKRPRAEGDDPPSTKKRKWHQEQASRVSRLSEHDLPQDFDTWHNFHLAPSKYLFSVEYFQSDGPLSTSVFSATNAHFYADVMKLTDTLVQRGHNDMARLRILAIFFFDTYRLTCNHPNITKARMQEYLNLAESFLFDEHAARDEVNKTLDRVESMVRWGKKLRAIIADAGGEGIVFLFPELTQTWFKDYPISGNSALATEIKTTFQRLGLVHWMQHTGARATRYAQDVIDSLVDHFKAVYTHGSEQQLA